MIRLRYATRVIQLTGAEKGLATGAHTRDRLKKEFIKSLSTKPGYGNFTAMDIDDSTLTMMIGKYSEQFIFQPLEEIRQWMAFSGGLFYEPGYPDLYYSIKNRDPKRSPNKSAISGVGEGLAGCLAQKLYKCRRMSRPNHDFPDIVMRSGPKVYMVEAKSSSISEADVKSTIDDELPRMTSFVASCSDIDSREIVGLLIGTAVMRKKQFLECSCFITEVRVV